MSKARWKKVGHRTLKFMGEGPKLIVRFGTAGPKAKLLEPHLDAAMHWFGYENGSAIDHLLLEASAEWARIKESEVVR